MATTLRQPLFNGLIIDDQFQTDNTVNDTLGNRGYKATSGIGPSSVATPLKIDIQYWTSDCRQLKEVSSIVFVTQSREELVRSAIHELEYLLDFIIYNRCKAIADGMELNFTDQFPGFGSASSTIFHKIFYEQGLYEPAERLVKFYSIIENQAKLFLDYCEGLHATQSYNTDLEPMEIYLKNMQSRMSAYYKPFIDILKTLISLLRDTKFKESFPDVLLSNNKQQFEDTTNFWKNLYSMANWNQRSSKLQKDLADAFKFGAIHIQESCIDRLMVNIMRDDMLAMILLLADVKFFDNARIILAKSGQIYNNLIAKHKSSSSNQRGEAWNDMIIFLFNFFKSLDSLVKDIGLKLRDASSKPSHGGKGASEEPTNTTQEAYAKIISHVLQLIMKISHTSGCPNDWLLATSNSIEEMKTFNFYIRKTMLSGNSSNLQIACANKPYIPLIYDFNPLLRDIRTDESTIERTFSNEQFIDSLLKNDVLGKQAKSEYLKILSIFFGNGKIAPHTRKEMYSACALSRITYEVSCHQDFLYFLEKYLVRSMFVSMLSKKVECANNGLVFNYQNNAIHNLLIVPQKPETKFSMKSNLNISSSEPDYSTGYSTNLYSRSFPTFPTPQSTTAAAIKASFANLQSSYSWLNLDGSQAYSINSSTPLSLPPLPPPPSLTSTTSSIPPISFAPPPYTSPIPHSYNSPIPPPYTSPTPHSYTSPTPHSYNSPIPPPYTSPTPPNGEPAGEPNSDDKHGIKGSSKKDSDSESHALRIMGSLMGFAIIGIVLVCCFRK